MLEYVPLRLREETATYGNCAINNNKKKHTVPMQRIITVRIFTYRAVLRYQILMTCGWARSLVLEAKLSILQPLQPSMEEHSSVPAFAPMVGAAGVARMAGVEI